MATAKIYIKDGTFTTRTGELWDEESPKHIKTNGWDCRIKNDGSLVCQAEREYSDGTYSMRYSINKDGYARTTLTTPERFDVIKKGYVTGKGIPFGDGVVNLSGGDIWCRYAYYRDSAFQQFLDKYGITAVKHEDPNQSFIGMSGYNGRGVGNLSIYTDGRADYKVTGYRNRENGFNYDVGGPAREDVRNATWAIVTVNINPDYDDLYQYDANNERALYDFHYLAKYNYPTILYTLENDVMSLEPSIAAEMGIPMEQLKPEASQEQSGRTVNHSVFDEVFQGIDELNKAASQSVKHENTTIALKGENIKITLENEHGQLFDKSQRILAQNQYTGQISIHPYFEDNLGHCSEAIIPASADCVLVEEYEDPSRKEGIITSFHNGNEAELVSYSYYKDSEIREEDLAKEKQFKQTMNNLHDKGYKEVGEESEITNQLGYREEDATENSLSTFVNNDEEDFAER